LEKSEIGRFYNLKKPIFWHPVLEHLGQCKSNGII
jgi:hypothetical protein